MVQEHGGDVRSYTIAYGQRPLDYSANGSPLGMPEGARRAAEAALAQGADYPDPWCRDLRAALGTHLGLPTEWILCGNGASDLLYRLVLAVRPERALVTAPTFSEYEAALRLAGCAVVRYALAEENAFDLTDAFLPAITPEMDLVILCQPGNPTGRVIPRELLLQILDRCEAVGALLVVDECFVDFLEARETLTMQGALVAQDTPAQHGAVADPCAQVARSLIILRAFTKFYGMAGLRLGYCLSADAELLARMLQAGPPWAVSSVAQAAGIAALDDADYAARLRTLVAAERPVLMDGLQALGCRVIPGAANYLLFHVPENTICDESCDAPDASEAGPGRSLGERMQAHGILIRDCRNYVGLEPGWYRVAVRTAAENARLLETLREVMVEEGHGEGTVQ